MADVENVIKAWDCCNPYNRKCKECPYEKDCYHDGISRHMVADAITLLKSQQAEIERLCKKIGAMKESIEDAIMSETTFYSFDDLNSYVDKERCRSEEWTGGIRDAIQSVRDWGE